MAFEDRSSPNTATSEGGGSGNFNSPNSPESTRTSSYTCMTISNSAQVVPKMEHSERSFFRITSFALPSPKRESDSPVSYRTPSPASSMSPPPEVIQPIKYSIRNILEPDFGKNAVLKTKSHQPNKAIGFRPYEIENKKSALGSLCQAVSQIGTTTPNIQNNNPKLPPSAPSSPVSLKSPSLLSPKEVKKDESNVPNLWPAWIYCTRYSDRPSSGPRSRRMKKPNSTPNKSEDKRPRTAFSSAQLARLKAEFNESRYLTESRRQKLSAELGLNEAQIKIWFQNKRAKIKKSSGQKNPLALQLMAQGLYNHSTVACDEDDMPLTG